MDAAHGPRAQEAAGRSGELLLPALVIRPILAADAGALRVFHADLSDEVGHRYFGGRTELSAADLRLFTCVDGTDRLSVVAFDGPRLVGLARADRLGDQVNAEVAVVVDDDHRGLGIGTALLERLIEEARAVGIAVFEADIWADDHRMHSVFHRLGFRVRSNRDAGVVRLVFLVGPSATYELACRKRRRHLGFAVRSDTET